MHANVRNVSRAMRFRFSVRASSRNSIAVNSSGPIHREPVQFARQLAGAAIPPRMSFRANILGGVRGVAATFGLAVAIILAPVARSQPGGETPDDPKLLPEPGRVVAAYQTLRGWLDAFDLPGPDDPRASLPLTNAGGVCVILRQAGRVLGAGVDTTGGEHMVRRAAGRAFAKVLADPAFANLRPDLAAAPGPALLLELEVAGRPVPLLGRNFEDVARQLAPGRDGVAVRRGDQVAMLFPSQMRNSNSAGRAERLLRALSREIGLPPLTLEELSRRFDVSIYRFRTTHLAQGSPDGPPFETFRGDTLVTGAEVTPAAIAATAAGIARHLERALAPLPAPIGIMGTYRPDSDRFDPLIAPPVDQATAAWALAKFAGAPGIESSDAQAALATSRRILVELAEVVEGEPDPLADPVACAAIVHAGLQDPQALSLEGVQPLFGEAAARVRAAFTPEGGFAGAETGDPVSPHGRALIASAMARLLAEQLLPVDPDLVRRAIDGAWSSLPGERQVTLLPWLAWAESDYAAATGEMPGRVDHLRSMRDVLDASRVGTQAVPGPPDLAGGLALSSGHGPAATAQTLRPAVFLAWMVRQPGLTAPRESDLALGRVLQTVRFLMQLAVRPSSTWTYLNPAQALGGVRAAAWDTDQPTAAQAMGLAFAAETLISLEALSRAPGNP